MIYLIDTTILLIAAHALSIPATGGKQYEPLPPSSGASLGELIGRRNCAAHLNSELIIDFTFNPEPIT